MNECFNYYANEMSTRNDVDDEIYSSCDEMFRRHAHLHKTSNNEQCAIAHDIRDAYYETFDVDEFIRRNNESRNSQKFDFVYSRMHAQSFVIMNMFE
jgi:hypothetical protein